MDKAGQQELESLIAGCKRGESESFSRLIDAYSTRIYGYFYRLSGDRTVSDDLLSELFVKLVEKIGHYRGGNFEGWLFTVASNLWRDWLRSKQRDDKVIESRKEVLELEAKQRRQSGLETEMFDRLGRELERIDQESRELIMLRYYSQMSFKEIAEAQSVPIGTVLSKVHRGLKKLRELMEQYSHE
jgi:RNA polymerase sigma-70 factor (ECF subfamily)